MEVVFIGLSVGVAFGIAFYFNEKHKEDQLNRDLVFKNVLKSLEEKAKRDGTLKVSYFDTNK